MTRLGSPISNRPPSASSAERQNPPICNNPLHTAKTSKPLLQFDRFVVCYLGCSTKGEILSMLQLPSVNRLGVEMFNFFTG